MQSEDKKHFYYYVGNSQGDVGGILSETVTIGDNCKVRIEDIAMKLERYNERKTLDR